jgi:hypothetical protein
MKTMPLNLASAALLLVEMFGFVAVAVAETTAMLQIGVKGRAGVDRNRLLLFERMPGGRDVIVVISCRADEHNALAIAIDFGVGAIWNIEGEDVAVALGASGSTTYRMSTRDDVLTLAGASAVELSRRLLAADVVTFTARATVARFDLKAVARHVARFRPACSLG